MRSDRVKKGLERAPARALLHATGLPKGEIDKPFIGIGNSSTDLVPGHLNLPELARFVEKGVHAGGGYPFLFNVGALCDGIAMGHKGMFYSLPFRELVADMVESIVEAHALDGRTGAEVGEMLGEADITRAEVAASVGFFHVDDAVDVAGG